MYRTSFVFIAIIFLLGCVDKAAKVSKVEDSKQFTETPVLAAETSTPLSTQKTFEPQFSQTPTNPTFTATPLAISSSPAPLSATETPINCDQRETAIAETRQSGNSEATYLNHVLGLEMTYPEHFQLVEDQYLSEAYGFTLLDPANPELLSFRGGWLYELEAAQFEARVEHILDNFSSIPIERRPLVVDGYEGVALSPVPGISESTYVYVKVDDGRLFEFIVGKVPLDELAQMLLDSIHFYKPTIPLDCLDIPSSIQPSLDETPEGME